MPQISESRKRNPRYYWGRIIAANVVASVIVLIVFSGLTWRTPPREALTAFGVALVFASCIGPLLGVAMPRMAPVIWGRLRFPWNWAAIVAMMVTLAMAGSVAAITVLTAIGYLPPGRFFEWFLGSLKAAIVVTLTVGLFVTVYETMEAQLREATLALRTKERDEAEARRLAAEAQLASIESRVQPHFLFNTLNSIAALVHDDPAGAERMTGQLASLLRSALDSTATPLVPLDQELSIVRAYLDIERVRFGDRLRYAVDLGDGTASALVPRMALQTLVENSVKYAVSPRREGGSIHVRAAAANGRVRVSVDDDGPGFDARIRPEGHGLDLLAGRLKMLFGERAWLQIDSRAGSTCVTVDLPGDGRTTASSEGEAVETDARIYRRR
jgi:sensor histidine kinase YesM